MTQAITKILMNDLKPDSHLQAKLDLAYDRVMNSGRYIGGAEVEAFEQEWAAYCGVKYCVACGNGYDALLLVLLALAADQYPYVRISEETFPGAWQAVRLSGSYPAPLSWPHYGIAVYTHLYGIIQPFPPDGEFDHWRLEDACQAHGAEWSGKRAGGLADAACFSFYPTKNLGAYGDAGAVTTDNEFIATRARELRNYGGETAGINSRMDPLQAAFLRAKLPYLDGWNERRREHASIYMRELAGIPGLELPAVPPECTPVYHQYAVRVAERDRLRAYLTQAGIETLIHYPRPPHKVTGAKYDLPEADAWALETLSFPIAPHLSCDDIRRVAEMIRGFYGV